MARMSEPDGAPRATPAPAPTPAAPAADEISLRELYLVLRRRAPWIAAATVVAAVVAFAFLNARPDVFVAEASAVVARTPVSVGGGAGLVFRPELDVTFETYSTLAFSRGVLEAVIEAVPETGLGLGGARDALTLVRLAGSANQPSSLLAVAHRARATDPVVAAALATRWAQITLETVRTVLNENLDEVERITTAELLSARMGLEAAEEALRAFREANDASAAPALLAGAQARAVSLANRRDAVELQFAARTAELASLDARDDPDALVALGDVPEAVTTLAAARWTLAARIAGHAAELDRLRAQEAAVATEVEALSAAVARAQTTIAGLERAVLRADAEVATLAAIEPTVAYVAQLAPAGARLLAEAAVPVAPEGRSTLLVTLLAAVVVAFGGVVVALIAEAVRDPAR